MGLKSVLKRSTIIKKIYFFPMKRKMHKLDASLEQGKEQRINGNDDLRYLPLRSLKDKYSGERCFIVATGPSLTIKDLELLKNELCFSMNSICKLYDDTSWRPSFYGIQDRHVFLKLKEVTEKYFVNYSCTFVTDEIYNLLSSAVQDKVIKFPFNVAYHRYEQEFGNFYSKFSDNAYGIVYDGYSITYSLLQIAVYMGFKEIYLLGCDCNYPKGQRNHIVESGYIDKNAHLNHDKMMTGYIEAKKYADEHGIKIINCTRGGMLEVFPRMTLEEVLNNK